jgi:hypothetical protein
VAIGNAPISADLGSIDIFENSSRAGSKPDVWVCEWFVCCPVGQMKKSNLDRSEVQPSHLNQGTLYPALVRLEQYGWIKGTWGKTENNREAKYYEITKAGQKALGEETQKWRRMAALVERVLLEES